MGFFLSIGCWWCPNFRNTNTNKNYWNPKRIFTNASATIFRDKKEWRRTMKLISYWQKKGWCLVMAKLLFQLSPFSLRLQIHNQLCNLLLNSHRFLQVYNTPKLWANRQLLRRLNSHQELLIYTPWLATRYQLRPIGFHVRSTSRSNN